MSRHLDQLESFTPEQRAVLELKLRDRLAQRGGVPRIARRNDRTTFPLSFAQERLWFVEQLDAGASNNMSGAARLEGPLSRAALEASVSEIIRRHEVLRGRFVEQGGRPVQQVLDAFSCEISVIPAAGPSDVARLERARELATIEAHRPFDLAAGQPLMRAALIQLGADDHVLVLTIHHIASDGWSLGVIVRELSAFYSAFAAGRPASLDDPAIQYADFAAWQRAFVSGERLKKQTAWWREQLHGLPRLEIPADRPVPARMSTEGGRESTEIDAEVVSALREVGQQSGATLFMVLLAAFQALLARWASVADLAVASPVAGRNHREFDEMVGLFVNTLVFRARVSGAMTFTGLLQQVRDTASTAMARQDVPFDMLVGEIEGDRTLSHSPITPAVFVLQNIPTTHLTLDGLRVSGFEFERTTARFDVCMFVTEEGERLRASIEYRRDLFLPETVRRIARSYARLLAEVARNPDCRIDALRLVDEDERRQMLVDWNATAKVYPPERSVHELVARQASARPEAEAVVCGPIRLTYVELETRATRFAQVLHSHGVRRGTRVGISCERSVDLIVALLGILKAGGAYVSLDATYPTERLRYMTENAGIEVVVVDSGLRQRFDGIPVRLLTVGDAEDAIQDVQLPNAHPGDPSYVSYTSGSTGMPKGVEVPHRAVVRLLCGVDYVRLNQDETILQLAPVAFDASTFEIWGALVHGARLIVYPDRIPQFEDLGAIINGESVTTMWLTASLYNTIIDKAPEILRGLRQLLIGGEALSREHVRRGLALLPNTSIINGYGPTEGTTFTCCHTIEQADVELRRSIPIGRPIANTRVHVLDARLEPAPIGVPGELCIAGDGLAIGYVGAARLTAERFTPDPFGVAEGGRIYRTGDLVRYGPDGLVEYIGRRDQQIKLRGYRIELGEIEAVLAAHPAVNAGVAAVRDVGAGNILAAYFVAREGSSPSDSELRAFLKERLPDYMVPAVFVRMDAIPLTANGKVDRDALPSPDSSRVQAVPAEPRNEVDVLVVDICRELLAAKSIGISDNFFALGGHSLLATQLSSRLRQALQIDVSIRMVFETQTLAELSDLIVDQLLASE